MSDIYGKVTGKYPALGPQVQAVQDAASCKLYTTMIEAFFELIKEFKKEDGPLFLELMQKDLVPMAANVNPLRFMELVGMLLAKCGESLKDLADPEKKLEFLAKMFEPFDTKKDDDVEMQDAKAPPPRSAFGNKSHYARAAEKDFRDCKALYWALKVELLVTLGSAATKRASQSGGGSMFGSMFGCSSSSKAADDAKTEAEKHMDEAKDLVDTLHKELFKDRPVAEVPAKVFSYYHFAQMKLYAALNDASAYYKACVNYLRFTPADEIQARTDVEELAISIGLSTLVAPGEYNFGEALELGIWELPGLKNLWIYELLYAFREGKYEYYDACTKKHKATIDKQSQLSSKENKDMIYEKFCCCVLMEFAFQLPKNKRRLSLTELAKVIRVDDVEKLLINAMCANLIKGSIDGVEGTFAYTWVRPRYLDASRLQVLQERVSGWCDQTSAVLSQVEELTPELLVSV